MKKQRGFTLIEILIVVIILAVLAAMVLPRFMGQTENAYIAEANQTLGSLRRAITTATDQGLTVGALTTTNTQANMATLGLQGIPTTNYTYTCTAGGDCTATSARSASNTITLTLAGAYSCAGDYTVISPTKGCRPTA
ncbi:MAG: prepilin-type N-terminal cleavage/methylation domain-containing protein [Candidatus Omnitrophota bacterium]|jgi:prepilin-type N-terminal cleavage/methylation domain-containing protein